MKRSFIALAAGATAVLFAPRAFAQGDTSASTSGSTDTSATTGTTNNANANANASAPTSSGESATDVLEKKGESYYFLGANYRLNLVPGFLIGMFVREGPSLVATSTAGLSFDYRKDHFSIVTGLNFTEYGFDPVLFLQNDEATHPAADPGNWGLVHSTLKAVYLTVDLLWSVPIAKGGQVDFEFGFSAGLGGIFGDLYNTWVSDNPAAGTGYKSPDGQFTRYQCSMSAPVGGVAPGNGSLPQGCNTGNHQNATISKTGPGPGYREPNWFDGGGGSVPTVFPWLSLPIIGFRFKPIKELEMRLNGGFSVTGFFVNFAMYYGFESTKK